MWIYRFEDDFSMASLRRVRRPDPEPGPHDVVLRMRAAALNFRDLAIMRGEYHVKVGLPLVPLSDGAGEVLQVGSKVTRLRIGDLACPVYLPNWIDGPLRPQHGARRLGGPNDGVLSELMCLPEDEVVPMPGFLDPVEAATLPVAGVTAWHSLFELDRLRPDDAVLVQGSGGVSTIAIQLAAAAGARVIAVTRGRHADRLRELGAGEVLSRFDDVQADVALNVAGGETLTPMIAATRLGGRVHVVGYAADRIAELDIFTAIQHAVTIRVATGGSRADFEALATTIERQGIRPVVDRVFPLDDLADAVEHLERGGHLGKVVVAW
ncbi:NAD(P)-dependent alcohol dehydrogenase [Kutzneria buriramensis]|uniref:D-arabinose 1-dehydrogenase-like Zn-dependent alcohol dehydrogenase n=1 Tax=Kutzneria buriramensis TaxID=1045776 RepID=A0A3E0HPD6_9PSEU|nr:NAD(P)-dependent alcohol dehydrogenase [Kutzneria buriramensis]REH48160.1 D-arabinose 1-dehydrogenase-like Zn-dependent alcohol dehydrogenase [Kutzneria buriramensis]